MNRNLKHALAVVIAGSTLMVSTAYAASYDQSAPSASSQPSTMPADGSNMMPPPPPPPPPSQGQTMDPGMNMPDQSSGMMQTGPGDRSSAPMPSAPQNSGSQLNKMTTPPPGNNMPSSGVAPQSKRTPVVKSKSQVSKR